jgi:hypothetical protein
MVNSYRRRRGFKEKKEAGKWEVREGKGRKGKRREAKGSEGKRREAKGREGKGREGKGRKGWGNKEEVLGHFQRKRQQNKGKDMGGEDDLCGLVNGKKWAGQGDMKTLRTMEGRWESS